VKVKSDIPTTDFLWKSTLPTTNDNKYPLTNQECFPTRAFHFCVCYYSKDFSLNGNYTFPHIALVRAQDDSKGLEWIILTLPVLSNQRAAVFKQQIYLSYSDETRFRESSHTTHLVLNGKILFLHTSQENSVTVYSIGLRNFDFPTMKTFKAPRITLTSQNGYLLQFSYWLKTRITDPLIGNLIS
jgi:hypothetical protein